jgi:autotransporter strand-loop-strand O-heptosyltransferase
MEMKASIILRTNNRPEFFSQSLSSIEYQTNDNWEVIIFDDSGLKENLEIVNEFKKRNKDKRIVYLTSISPYDFFKKSWFYMSDLSEGDILIRLDDDDLLSKDSVEYFLSIYQKYPDLDLSYGSSLKFSDEKIIELIQTKNPHEQFTTTAWIPYTIENNMPWDSPLVYHEDFYSTPQKFTSIIHASNLDVMCVYHTYVIRKSSLDKVKDKFEITSNFVDDLEFFASMEYLGLKHTSLKKITTYVRQHNVNRVTSQESMVRDNLDQIRRKVDRLRPNNFESNILTLNPEDDFTYELNSDLEKEFKEVLDYCTGKRLKVLFLAPHLSTGGMPAFLLKRIETIQKYSKNIELYVVEYSLYSDSYVVQRDQIRNLLPEGRFWSLGWFGSSEEEKLKLIDIILDNNIDVVHIEEIPEGFDYFNVIPKKLLNLLYSHNRTWKVVETCHNIWFNPKTSKTFNPDAYAFCTPYHQKVTFLDEPPYSDVIEFPIENNFRSDDDKIQSQINLGLDTNKIHVVNVGLWTPGKNQKEGVEIARLLEESHPNIEFHFIGNQASNFQEYWGPIMENLPKNVRVWGERSDVLEFMKASDVFMFNSDWECNPIVLRESISLGLKILSRNLPQYLDMFTQYITEIDSDINVTKNKLLTLVNSLEKYELQPGQNLEFAKKHSSFYEKVISLPKMINIPKQSDIKINQHYVGNPFLEILGETDSEFKIEVFDENDKLYYENVLPANRWIKLNRTYFTKWKTKIWENDHLIYHNVLDYTNKRVYISFDSGSLGDTIAWIPYCLEFKKKHNCHVIVSTFWNKLFKKSYPELEFVDPGIQVNNIHGMYKLGWFYHPDSEPVLPNIIPLQKAATNILGLDFKEIKPTLDFKKSIRPYNQKYVTIATNSTAGCKFWTKEGWEGLIEYLHNNGYKIINVSKEDNPMKHVQKIKDTSIENTMNVIYHSDFFIGLSSGLSWLSWALGKHVVMISNFTELDHEFTSNCTRITNNKVCNGCWNNPDFKFDKGDWYWCPIHKGTDRQFECHTSITSEMVINEIKKGLN